MIPVRKKGTRRPRRGGDGGGASGPIRPPAAVEAVKQAEDGSARLRWCDLGDQCVRRRPTPPVVRPKMRRKPIRTRIVGASPAGCRRSRR